MDNRKIKLIKSYNGHQSGNIYDKNGLSPALCCTDYKAPLKIMEDRGGNSMDKDIIGNNFTEVEKGKYITTDRERESCYAITTRPRSRPLHKKQDNYVLEENNMLKLRESTKKGYKEADVGDGVATDRINCTVRRGVSHKDATGTLNTHEGSWGTVTSDYRIRKLTPKECERLQAFPDDWTKYGKDGEKISDTQRYKCMGNAVTTSVVTFMINQMFGGLDEE